MKVPATGRNRSRATASALKQPGGAPAIPFSALLQNEQESQLRVKLDKLYQQVMDLAEQISLSSPLSEWDEFRQVVAEFLLEVRKSFQLKRSQVWDHYGNHRLLLLVEQADRELVALGLDFLNQAQGDLQFLERLKRLKGMLIDIRS